MIKFLSKFHAQILWYSFTTDNRFLLTSSSLSQENPSCSASQHINNCLSVYLFFDSELNNEVVKTQLWRAFKSYFSSTKKIEKADIFLKFA